MSKKYNIVIVGATGLVGQNLLNLLVDFCFPINKIFVVSSPDNIGKKIIFGNIELILLDIEKVNFCNIDIVFFCTGDDIIKKYVKTIVQHGSIIIDKSSSYRTDVDVPLIVPEVNLEDLHLYKKKNIIAIPNCCVIPLSICLFFLDKIISIKRVVVSTYQSVSGAGKKAIDELMNNTNAKCNGVDVHSKIFPKSIAFNLFPQIGNFNDYGYSEEEQKIQFELNKIIGKHIDISITCVRVPIIISHCFSINIEFIDNIEYNDIINTLQSVDCIKILNNNNYTTPQETQGTNYIYISRVRHDNSKKNIINLWMTVDNLRKGASLNSLQTAFELIKYI